jgi:hypothetical protein
LLKVAAAAGAGTMSLQFRQNFAVQKKEKAVFSEFCTATSAVFVWLGDAETLYRLALKIQDVRSTGCRGGAIWKNCLHQQAVLTQAEHLSQDTRILLQLYLRALSF